jgi:hydroxypyruvate reductase
MGQLPPGTALLCAASDGVDGSSGKGGALVTREDADRAGPAAIADALSAFDDAAVHAALGTHLAGGGTGHNLADVHVVARTAR